MFADLLDLVIPSRCVACGARGDPCCAGCFAIWGGLREVVRTPCAGVVRVFSLARYQSAARRVLIAYKERQRRDLAPVLGRALADAVPALPGLGTGTAICLVPAPSRRSASRSRGGPHVVRLAAAAAEVLAGRGSEVAVAPALRLGGGVRDAVGLGRAERVANLAGRLKFRPEAAPPPGIPVVVLDDVVTTGATAAACAGVLGARGIEVAAVLTLLAAG